MFRVRRDSATANVTGGGGTKPSLAGGEGTGLFRGSQFVPSESTGATLLFPPRAIGQ